MPDQRPITISILATPDTSPSTLFGLYDVLSSVGIGWEAFVAGTPEAPRFDVRIVAVRRDPFRCAGDVLVTPHLSIEEVEDTDIALVASLVVPTWIPLKVHDGREFKWLTQQLSRGAVVASACTGALILAESGLLNGWEATTHWAYRDLFRVCYPEVRLRLEKNLCGSGQDNQIVTSGGATAWQELALHLVTRFCGIEHAVRTAKFWLIPERDKSQATHAAMSRRITHDDAVINDCQVWIAEHCANANPISVMIQRSGLPPTTFARRFNRATGYHPMDYVHTLRVEEAKELLEKTDDAIDQIGRDVGYEDPASFRRLFKRKSGLTPSHYRRRFGRPRFEQYDLAR